MKTIKELADIGAAAAFADNSRWHYMAVSKDSHGWEDEETARQAFAQAVRDAVEKPLLDEITVMGAKIEELETDLDDLESSRNEWMKKWKTNQVLLEKLVDKISAEPTPTTKTVLLDMGDIRATDEFQPCGEAHQLCTLRHADDEYVSLFRACMCENLTYQQLATNYLRRQHGSTEWKPCTKEVTV